MDQHLQFARPDRYPPLNLDLASTSSDALTMSSLTRQPFVQYASLSSQGSGSGPAEGLGGLRGFINGHGSQGFMQNQALPNPMMTQYIQDPSAPWNPICGNAAATQSPGGILSGQALSSFGGYRCPAPPSEADTVSQSVAGILSDSGYGSMARQSVGNPSVCEGEVDQGDTQSLVSQFQGLAKEDNPPMEEPQKRSRQSQRPAAGHGTVGSLLCPDCNTMVKTNSELKKHQARHNPPHKCDVLGCKKSIEGFSTKNDLDRHMRCVHKVRKADETVYRCNVGSCKDKPKDWPRQDNFRQHLKRKHHIDGTVDLTPYTFRTTGTADFASLGGPGVIAQGDESDVAAGSTAPPPWLEYPKTHITPASLIKRSPTFVQTGGMGQLTGASLLRQRDFGPLGGVHASRYQLQNNSQSAGLPRLDTGTVLSELSMGQASPQTLGAAAIEKFARAVPSLHNALDVSSHASLQIETHDRFRLQREPGRVIEIVDDEAAGANDQDQQSEQEEAESTGPDAMNVDGTAHESVSDNDGHYDTDSDDDELPSSTADAQANLLRDTGAQYSGAGDSTIRTPPSEVKLCADIPKQIDLDDESQASALIQSLLERGTLGKLLKKVGYLTPKEPETKEIKSLFGPIKPPSTVRETGPTNKCSDCPKVFHRLCELKKHQKRHAKPYACTFPRCDKRFGSKNDWKRHENSQHFQLEIWRCAEKLVAVTTSPSTASPCTSSSSTSPSAEPFTQQAQQPSHTQPHHHQEVQPQPQPQLQECGKVCHRRESLRSHLERDHGVRDPAQLDRKLADCRMGRNFESRFWCGFCQRTVEPTGRGGPAHSERFDHIDDHFNGRVEGGKRDIGEWVHVEGGEGVEGGVGAGDLVLMKHLDGHRMAAASAAVGVKGGRGTKGSSRKRALEAGEDDGKSPSSSSSSSSRAKRAKSSGGKKDQFWTCCECGQYWAMAIMNQCIPCSHTQCNGCEVWAQGNTERWLKIPAQSPDQQQGQGQVQVQVQRQDLAQGQPDQGQVMDGLMT